MPRYEAIREQIRRNPSFYPFEPCSENEITREWIEGVPEGYIDLRATLTFGGKSVAGMGPIFIFMAAWLKWMRFIDALYEEDEHAEMQHVLLFGDNGSGDAVGVLTTDNWALVEIWHDDNLSLHYCEERGVRATAVRSEPISLPATARKKSLAFKRNASQRQWSAVLFKGKRIILNNDVIRWIILVCTGRLKIRGIHKLFSCNRLAGMLELFLLFGIRWSSIFDEVERLGRSRDV